MEASWPSAPAASTLTSWGEERQKNHEAGTGRKNFRSRGVLDLWRKIGAHRLLASNFSRAGSKMQPSGAGAAHLALPRWLH